MDDALRRAIELSKAEAERVRKEKEQLAAAMAASKAAAETAASASAASADASDDSPFGRLLECLKQEMDDCLGTAKADSPIGQLLAGLKHQMEQSLRKVGETRSKLAVINELQQQSDVFKQSKFLSEACGNASKGGDIFWSLALGSLKPKVPDSGEWVSEFRQIQNKQIRSLHSMDSILRPEKLSLCFRTWSDISRAANSAIGFNITDMQVGLFFFVHQHAELVHIFDHANIHGLVFRRRSKRDCSETRL